MLARIDGKSPVEYLTDERAEGRRPARSRARSSRDPVADLGEIARRWRDGGDRDERRDRRRPRAGASGIRAAGRRWKRKSRSTSGAVGRAIAPAGASRGSREAIDLRDGGARFGGMDVTQAIANVDGPVAARARRPRRARTRPASTRR